MFERLSGLARIARDCGLALGIALSASAAAQTPPSQPGLNQLGGPGPCTQGTRREGFGTRGNYNWLYVPAGTGTPRSGGRCDDALRPVIFLAPGYNPLQLTPSRYQHLINNMVSNGYIVAFANAARANPDPGYYQFISGFDHAATTLNARAGNRMDLRNVGIWGHSFGAGAVPWLSKRFEERGWGAQSLWLSVNASSWIFFVPLTGAIDIPAHARALYSAYDDDQAVDQRVAIDSFRAIDVPDSQKDFVQVTPEPGYVGGHSLPTTAEAPNYLEYYGVYRNYQVVADCARTGLNCSADLTFMGKFADGRDATRATVSDNPADRGKAPADLVECGNSSNTGSNIARCGPTQ